MPDDEHPPIAHPRPLGIVELPCVEIVGGPASKLRSSPAPIAPPLHGPIVSGGDAGDTTSESRVSAQDPPNSCDVSLARAPVDSIRRVAARFADGSGSGEVADHQGTSGQAGLAVLASFQRRCAGPGSGLWSVVGEAIAHHGRRSGATGTSATGGSPGGAQAGARGCPGLDAHRGLVAFLSDPARKPGSASGRRKDALAEALTF